MQHMYACSLNDIWKYICSYSWVSAVLVNGGTLIGGWNVIRAYPTELQSPEEYWDIKRFLFRKKEKEGKKEARKLVKQMTGGNGNEARSVGGVGKRYERTMWLSEREIQRRVKIEKERKATQWPNLYDGNANDDDSTEMTVQAQFW